MPIAAARARSLRPQSICYELKDDEPAGTSPLLIKRAREQHNDVVSEEVTLAEATAHRLLARRGVRKTKDEPTATGHRRFQYEAAGELWLSDMMYAPKIRVHRQECQTYLIAVIDDATARTARRLPALAAAPSRVFRCSSRSFAAVGCRSDLTSTTTVRFGRDSSALCAPSSLSRSFTFCRTRCWVRARWSAGFAPCARSSCRCWLPSTRARPTP